jgi:thiamine transport system permease protein
MDTTLASCFHQRLIKPELWPGILVGILLFGLCLLLLGILGYHSQPIDWSAWYRDPYWQEVLRFTWLQACLSTLFSLVIAVPLACVLVRRRFWRRQWLLQLFSLSMVLPTVVVIFGLITLYGRQGWLAQLCTQLGFSYGGSLYGLPGIVLVHVFFNLPLATRLFFIGYDLNRYQRFA